MKGNLVGAHTLLALIAILLVITNSCVAATLAKANSSYHCNGGLGGCLIADDFELEFIMDSHFSRILIGGAPSGSGGQALDPKKIPCGTGKGKQYTPCYDEKRPVKPCGLYGRGCP